MATNNAELRNDDRQPNARLHLVAASTEMSSLTPFEADKFSEGTIATYIGALATTIKEASQSPASGRIVGSIRERRDYEAERSAERLRMASIIFKKFGMLQDAAEAEFKSAYTAAERTVEDKAETPSTRRDLTDTIMQYQNHPVIRAANSVTLVTSSETTARADAIEVQRAAAILLQNIEPLDIWAVDEN